MNSKSLHGDCREKLKEIEDNSIDSIVTDPPYELGFMGKKWDNTGIAYNIEVWKECLRVLKLGGHLLSFGGSRTYHRMACAIEDAGFEIRDQIMWIYGSGFPKSLNVSKAIDSKLNAEREVIGTVRRWGNAAGKGRGGQYMNEYEESIGGNEKFDAITASATKEAQQWEGWGTALKPAHEPIVVARKPIEGTVANNALTYGTGGINIDGCRISTPESWARDTTKDKSPITTGDIYNGGFNNIIKSSHPSGRFPANVILECICDEVVTEGKSKEPYEYKDKNYKVEGFIENIKPSSPSNYNDKAQKIIHTNPDCPCYIMDEQSGKLKSGFMKKDQQRHQDGGFNGGFPQDRIGERDTYGNSGGASRFFYCAKASKSERNLGLDTFEDRVFVQSNGGQSKSDRGEDGYGKAQIGINKVKITKNIHPTVKPISVMRYLVRLVTPRGGACLDPFMGSGTTGIACIMEGVNFLGIEQEIEYVKIAKARIAAVELPKADPALFEETI